MTKQSVEEIVNDIKEATEDIRNLLLKAVMTFENATAVDAALKGIAKDAQRMFDEHLNAVDRVVDKVTNRLRSEDKD